MIRYPEGLLNSLVMAYCCAKVLGAEEENIDLLYYSATDAK